MKRLYRTLRGTVPYRHGQQCHPDSLDLFLLSCTVLIPRCIILQALALLSKASGMYRILPNTMGTSEHSIHERREDYVECLIADNVQAICYKPRRRRRVTQ